MYDFIFFLCFPSFLHTSYLFYAADPTMCTRLVDDMMSITGAVAGFFYVTTYSPSCRVKDGKLYGLEV